VAATVTVALAVHAGHQTLQLLRWHINCESCSMCPFSSR
jgi:hypothetical protein